MVPIVVVVSEDTALRLEEKSVGIAAEQPGFFGPMLENHGWTPVQIVGGALISSVLDEDDDKVWR